MERLTGNVKQLMGIVVVAVALVGCGGNASGAAGGPASQAGNAEGGAGETGGGGNASDMCSLLTDAEVESATGLAVTSSGPGDFDAAHYCEWQLEPGTNVEGVPFDRLVAISKYEGPSSYDLAAGAGSPVPDIGDKAVTVDHVVNVLDGDTHFAVVVILHQPGDEDAALFAKEDEVGAALAKIAADRL